MSVIKTIEDGWDCCPELTEVTDSIDNIDSYVYEIKNCVRSSDLESMVAEMRDHLQEAIDKLDEIDTDIEYETCDDEDLYDEK